AQDQLAEQDADLDRFAESDTVRHQDARPELLQRLVCRVELVGGRTQGRTVADVDGGVGRRLAPQQAVEVETRVAIARRGVGDEVRRIRAEDLRRVEVGEERRVAPADQHGGAGYVEPNATGRGPAPLADDPLLVANDDARTRSDVHASGPPVTRSDR